MDLSKNSKIVLTVGAVILVAFVIGLGVHFGINASKVPNPYLELVPQPEDGKPISDIEAKFYIGKLSEATQSYRLAEHKTRCGDGVNDSQQNCAPKLEQFHPCNLKTVFSYRESKPCIYLKLRNAVNWSPEYINKESDAPQEMPEALKKNITDANRIWVSCEGKTDADKELLGPVTIVPDKSYGFTQSRYPITSTEEYAVPLVPIRFEQAPRNVTINVICRAYAKNFPSGSISKEFPLYVGGYIKN